MRDYLISAQDWTAGQSISYGLAWGNSTYTVYSAQAGYRFNAQNSWALKALDKDTLRFEVRAGDTNWFDEGSGKERSEIGSQLYSQKAPLHVSYDLMVEPGAANTAKWVVLGQLHQQFGENEQAAPPPFAIVLRGEKLTAELHYRAADGTVVTKQLWADTADFVRGKEYAFDVYATVQPDGSGRVVLAQNGAVVVNYTGPMGYGAGDFYWKEGIYRSGAAETMAAQFSDLQITSGDQVRIPPPGTARIDLAHAPELALAKADAVDGHGAATLTGKAGAGATVALFDGATRIATVSADAHGTYSVTASLGSGTHLLTAATVGAGGVLSSVSDQVVVAVGASKDIVGQLTTLSKMDTLGAVVITDTHVLTVPYASDVAELVTQDGAALSKIVGDYQFAVWSGVAGNRSQSVYAADGTLTQTVTTNVDQKTGFVNRVTTAYAEPHDGIAREVLTYQASGAFAKQYQAFDAAGTMREVTQWRSDGSMISKTMTDAHKVSVQDSFNTAGVMTSHVITYPAGEGALGRETWAYQVANQAWTSTYSAVDKSGATVASQRYFADGTTQYQWQRAADGSEASATYAAGGRVLSTVTKDVAGVLVTRTYEGTALKSVTTNYPDKSSEMETYTAGTLTNRTIFHAPGDALTKEVYTFDIKGQAYTSQYQAYAGTKIVTAERFHADGTLDYGNYVDSNGGTTIRKYSANGTIVSDVFTAADKSTSVKLFTNGVISKETVTLTTPMADGSARIVYESNVAGQSFTARLSNYDAAGKLIAISYPSDISGSRIAGSNGADVLIANPLTGGRMGSAGGEMSVMSMMRSAGPEGATLLGNDGNDRLVGSRLGDLLDGGAGSDTMIGGLGNDTYRVDSAGDVVVELESEGIDTIETTLTTYTLGEHLENLTYIGGGNATLIGNAADNILTGSIGNDTLDGGQGNDQLFGGDGDDQLNGGRGSDVMIGGAGNDVYIVDEATDVVIEDEGGGYDRINSYATTYRMADNVEDMRLFGTARDGFGNASDNVLTGNALANLLDGGAGDDTLWGNDGDDRLYGGDGNDKLYGGNGDDLLVGGKGTDYLVGGAGADRFAFFDGDSHKESVKADRIVDFSHAQGDKIDLSGMDANTLLAGDQAFTFLASKPDTGIAGSVWLVHSDPSSQYWQVNGDVDGDGKVDFVIRVETPFDKVLGASDFIL